MADIKKIKLPDGTSYDIGNLIEIFLTWSNNVGTLRDYTNWEDVINGTHTAGQSTIYFFRYTVGGKSVILFSTSYTSEEADTIFYSQPDEDGYIYKGIVQYAGNTVTINSYRIYSVPGDDGSVADGDVLTATVSTSGQTRTFSYGWQTPSSSSSDGIVRYYADGAWSGESYDMASQNSFLFSGTLYNNKTHSDILSDLTNNKLPIIQILDVNDDNTFYCFPQYYDDSSGFIKFSCITYINDTVNNYNGLIYVVCSFNSNTNIWAKTSYLVPGNIENGKVLKGLDNGRVYWNWPIDPVESYKTYTTLQGPVICFTKDEQYILPINSLNTTVTNKTLTSEQFDPFKEIYFYDGSVLYSSDQTVYNLYYNINRSIPLAYSFNLSNSLVIGKEVYIVCNPASNGKVTLANTPITQTLPTTADGKIYILLGITNGTNSCWLLPNKTIYYYSNGALRVWTNPDSSGGSGLPSVSSSDNGKFLRVVNGAWAAATVPDANGVSF